MLARDRGAGHDDPVSSVRVAGVLLVAVLLTGCGGDEGAQDCTLIGGVSAISASVDPGLGGDGGTVVFTVCDADGCATASAPLEEGRTATAPLEEFGRELAAGPVDLTVELRSADDAPLARRQGEVQLTRSYPNGEECDEGYLGASLDLRPEDGLAAGT